MPNEVNPERPATSKRDRSSFFVVRGLRQRLHKLWLQLLHLTVFAAASRRAAASVKVTPLPVAKLWSSFRESNNGGPYKRSGETLIVGPVRNSTHIKYLKRATRLTAKPPRCGVASIENAIVCGEGLILKKTPQGICAVAETLINASSDRSILPLIRRKKDALYVDAEIGDQRLPQEQTYVFLRQIADNNYGHWIIEGLPKVAIVADHFDIKTLKFIVTRHLATRESAPMRKVYLDSLAALGVEAHQIVPMAREPVEVPRLLYPLPLTIHPWVKAPRTIHILEALRDEIAAGTRGPRRIYVSRAQARKRHLVNEAEILAILRDLDVAVIYPEQLTFTEQVRSFAHAELVIGNSGANLTNAVFSQRGVTIFALTSEMLKDDFFWDLANLKSGRYFSLHGKAIGRSLDMNSDFSIDLHEFRTLLEGHVLKTK